MYDLSFKLATVTLLFITVALIVEYAIRKRAFRKESARNRLKQEQLADYSANLKHLKKELARKTEIAIKLPQITKMITERLPADAYPSIAVRSIKEFFHAAKVGYFAPMEGDASDYTLVVGVGFPPDWIGKIRTHSGDGILGLALLKKVVISRTDQDSIGRRSSRRSLEDLGLTPDFVAPVFGISGIAGALVVIGCPFPLDQEKAYLSMLSDLLSTMLQAAALFDSNRNGAWVDHLTGVANRFYFLQRFENEIRRTKNYKQNLAVFMFDIDEFKKVNDTYGHHAGDFAIQRLADVVKRNIRSSDLVARFGGDEFIILITSTTAERVHAFVEKLRELISASDIKVPGIEAPLRITISGGLAIYPVHGQSSAELLHAADDALYEAKRNGRNRILVAQSNGLYRKTGKGTDAILCDQNEEAEVDKAERGVPIFALGEFGGNQKG